MTISSPFLSQHKLLFLLILLTCIFFRFYNINWGAPFYFHPDERNIASSVTQLSFPNQMNPHFFAYGSFPIYGIYFTGIVFNAISLLLHLPSDAQLISITKVSFEYAIIISRLYSALFSILLLLVLYKVGIVLKNDQTAFIAFFLSATSVGFIQFAHFGTFETWLAFFSLLLLYFSIQYIKTFQYKYILLSSFILGLLISIKVSSLILFLVSLFTLAIGFCKQYIKTNGTWCLGFI